MALVRCPCAFRLCRLAQCSCRGCRAPGTQHWGYALGHCFASILICEWKIVKIRVALLRCVTCMSTVSLPHYHPIPFPTLFGVSCRCNGRCMNSFSSLLLKPQGPHCKHIIHSSGGLIVVADDAMVCTLSGHVSPFLTQASRSTQDTDAASHVQDGNIQSSRRPRTSPHVGHTCQRDGRRESSRSSKLN